MRNDINYAARRPVWSGLGTDISECSSIEEALDLSGLNFTVTQHDVATDDIYPVALPGYKANMKDDGTPLGIVSTKYQVVQNRDAFSFLDNLIEEGMKFERAGGLQNGRKVFVLAKMPDKYIISGEAINPYVVFLNSHDGSGSIRVLMTPIRMICLNMLNLALKNASRSWSAIHCGDINGKLEDAKNTLFYADQYMHELGSEIEILKHQNLSDAKVFELVETLIPTSKDMTELQIRNAVSKREDLMERYFHAPDLQSMRRTPYRFLNAVSDHATHSEPLRRRNTFNEALFARSVEGSPLVDKAYRLLQQAA